MTTVRTLPARLTRGSNAPVSVSWAAPCPRAKKSGRAAKQETKPLATKGSSRCHLAGTIAIT